ncbi:CBS domain-containing protein [Faecalibacter rhinopitheci]|uniref:CBS domain-containing protein n=1 Tax=Faecalibacter rhinopitheci TaxID=2779678 RepID=A0A8J7FMW9_9FLAO|nr:CBS domain-containing protein [Faecalibacter rhinopitheci]MBF0596850.1 CBS domain-containing protein [Faecalibacter rhinopitheci]
MYVTAYLSKDIIPGKVNYSPQHLLKMVQEMKLTHIPMFSGLTFIGNIAEEDLIELSTLEQSEVKFYDYTESFFLSEDHTIFEAFQLMYMNHTNILPVITPDSKYIGCVTAQSLIEAMTNFPFISEIAVSMVVSTATKELSMSAITNIVEANNGKVFGLMIIDEVEDRTNVLVRFSSSNLLSIGETFERYGYQVIQKFYNDEKQELLQNRYAQLLKYMNT